MRVVPSGQLEAPADRARPMRIQAHAHAAERQIERRVTEKTQAHP
jgi:hypothetical protein